MANEKKYTYKIVLDGTEKILSDTMTLTKAVKEAKAAAGSIQELSGQLEEAQKKYESLSEAERKNSEIGGVLADQIRGLNSELTEAQTQTYGLFETFERLNSGFNNTTEIVGGLVSVYQAGSDVVGLFGGNTQKLEKIIKDLNKVTTVINSLQKVNNLVLKEGSVIQKLFQGAVGGSTVAVKGFSKALISTGVGALVVALGYLIANFDDIKKKVLEVCPQLEGLGEVFEEVEAIVMGVGKAVLDYFLTPLRTAIAVVSKLMKGDFKGAMDAGINEVKSGLNVIKNYEEAYEEQKETQAAEKLKTKLEQDVKELESHIRMTESSADADWIYSKEGQAAYEELFLKKKELYADDKEKLDELMIEQNVFFKEIANYNKAKNDKIQADNKRAADQAKAERERIKNEIEQFFKDTQSLGEENLKNRLEKEKAAANTVEKLNAYYAKEDELIKKRSQESLQAIKEEYETLSAKMEEGTQEWIQLNESYSQRILEIKERTTNQEVTLEEEKNKAIEALRKKQEENAKKSLENQLADIEDLKKYIPKEIEYRGDDGKGIINVEATKKNIDEANRCLEEYIQGLVGHKTKIEEFYNGQMSLYSEDSAEYKKLQKEKEKALFEANKKINDAQKQMNKNQQLSTQIQLTYWKELSNKIKEHSDNIMKYVGEVAGMLNTLLQSELDTAKERLEEIGTKYDEVVEKKEESDERLKDLEAKAKDARGGALLVYQQQINEEMASNKQLSNQEKDLAKQKEKQEKEIAKKEKQMKKVELTQKIGQAIVNTALSVTLANATYAFPIGTIIGAILAAAGAIQIATMTKQLSKLEDGGLLNGKRHSDGGMRIEGTNIEVEGGEYVINRRSTKENLGLVNYINSQHRKLSIDDLGSYFNSGNSVGILASGRSMFADGGQLPVSVTDNNVGINTDNLIDAIRTIQIKPVVSVEDINHAQQNAVEVNSWIGM